MNIDYNAVTEILKSFLDNEKTEILGISVGEERQVREAIKNLLTAYEKEKEKNRILESKNIKLCDDNLELIKQNPYDKRLHYKYVETPKIEPQWYEKEE